VGTKVVGTRVVGTRLVGAVEGSALRDNDGMTVGAAEGLSVGM
jgi:hypothetical protein